MYNLNRLETPLIEDLTYDNPNYSESGVNLKNPGFSFGFNVINAQLAFYFGKKKFKKNMGISIGVAIKREVMGNGQMRIVNN